MNTKIEDRESQQESTQPSSSEGDSREWVTSLLDETTWSQQERESAARDRAALTDGRCLDWR